MLLTLANPVSLTVLLQENVLMDMKRDYYEDVQIFTSGTIVFWLGALMLLLTLFPFIAKNYYIYVANYMAINVIVVVDRKSVV